MRPPMNGRILLFYNSKSIDKLEELSHKSYPDSTHSPEDSSSKTTWSIAAIRAPNSSKQKPPTSNPWISFGKMDADTLNHLLSRNFYQIDEATANCALLSIQATHFRCGGVAISISLSHRIFDASSLETFALAWSAYTAGAAAISPVLDSPTLFPREDLDCTSATDRSEILNINICTKRFVFVNDAINRLRYNYKSIREENGECAISRVRAVCALIAKALIGVDGARHGRSRPCLVVQAFNMRQRTMPPLPKHTCGNLAIQSVTRSMSAVEAESMSVGGLIVVLGEAIDQTTSDCSRILTAGVDGLNEIVVAPAVSALEKSASSEVNVIWFSEWSKFGFYKADFGWGKPVWASIGPVVTENMAVLTEMEEGGGIEAWVHLKLNDMTHFEEDEGIKLYTKIV